MPGIDTKAVDKLLVILPNWLGDAVMSGALLRALLAIQPDLWIAGQDNIVDIFSNTVKPGHIIAWPRTSGGAFSGFWLKLSSIRTRADLLRRQGFTKVLIIPGSMTSALVSWTAGIPERLGYARDGRGFLLTKSLDHPRNFRTKHRVLYFLRLLSLFEDFPLSAHSLGCHLPEKADPSTFPLDIDIDRNAAACASDFFEENNISGPVVGVHIGASFGPSKRWPASKFVSVLAHLKGLGIRFSVLFVGGPEERNNVKDATRTLAKLGIPCFSSIGRTGKPVELAALIARCSVFLSTDSGPMHIAAALGKPQLAVFTSSSPAFTAPWSDRAKWLAPSLECSPCFGRNCPKAEHTQSYPCHEAIKPEDAARELAELLERQQADDE